MANAEEDYEVSGSLIDKNPVAARNHALKMAAKEAERAKRQAELDRIAAIERADAAARKEDARLAKEAALAESQRQRNEEYRQQALAEEQRKAREKAEREAEAARQAAEDEAREQAEAAAAAAAEKARVDAIRQAEQDRKDAIAQQRADAAARRAQMLKDEEAAAEIREKQIAEALRLKKELARAKQMQKQVPAGAEHAIWQKGKAGEGSREALKKHLGLDDREIVKATPAKAGVMPSDVELVNPWAGVLGKKKKKNKDDEEFGFEEEKQPFATIPTRLKSNETAAAAANQFLQHLVEDLGLNGMRTFRNRLKAGYGVSLVGAVDGLANMINVSPGNLQAISSLGILAFCGDKDLREYIRRKKVIPDSVDAWMGWLYGCRLYFDYVEWRTSEPDAPLDAWKIQEDSLPSQPNQKENSTPIAAKMRQKKSAHAKVIELVERLGVFGSRAGSSEAHTSVIMRKFDSVKNSFQLKLNTIGNIANKEQAKTQERLQESQLRLKAVRENVAYDMQQATQGLQTVKQNLAGAKVAAKTAQEELRAARREVEEMMMRFDERRAQLIQQKLIDVKNGDA